MNQEAKRILKNEFDKEYIENLATVLQDTSKVIRAISEQLDYIIEILE